MLGQIAGRTPANAFVWESLPTKRSELNTREGQHMTLFLMEIFGAPSGTNSFSTILKLLHSTFSRESYSRREPGRNCRPLLRARNDDLHWVTRPTENLYSFRGHLRFLKNVKCRHSTVTKIL